MSSNHDEETHQKHQGPIIEELPTFEFKDVYNLETAINAVQEAKATDQNTKEKRFRLKGKQAPSGWYKCQGAWGQGGMCPAPRVQT